MTARRFLTGFSLPVILLLAFLFAGCQSQPDAGTTAATTSRIRATCGEDLDSNGHEYIRNGQFRGGTANWQTVNVPGAQGTDTVSVENDTTCGTVAVFKRQDAGGVTGLIGLEQPVMADKNGLKNLEVQLVAKIDQQNLQSDGNLGGETPIFITVDYTTAAGQEKSWTHGLMLTDNINYPNRDQSISPVYWHTYKSGNLLTDIPDLSSVKKVTIGGNGQDFNSRIAFVSLLGS